MTLYVNNNVSESEFKKISELHDTSFTSLFEQHGSSYRSLSESYAIYKTKNVNSIEIGGT